MSTIAVDSIEPKTSGGAVLFPNRPCCHVRLTTSNSQDASNPYTTTGTDIKFDRIDINQGSCYDASTGRFTVPVAGIYEAKCSFLTDTSSTTNTQIEINKNGSGFHRGYCSVDNQHVQVHAHALLNCIAGNYITVQLDQGEIYISGDGVYSAFTVRLIG